MYRLLTPVLALALIGGCTAQQQTRPGSERSPGASFSETGPALYGLASECVEAMIDGYFSTVSEDLQQRILIAGADVPAKCVRDRQKCVEAVTQEAVRYTQPQAQVRGIEVFQANPACASQQLE